MLYLKRGISLTAFLNAVKGCAGDVLFQTEDGDSLNLKSALSNYLFAMIATNQNYFLTGHVVCGTETDYEKLADYLEEG